MHTCQKIRTYRSRVNSQTIRRGAETYHVLVVDHDGISASDKIDWGLIVPFTWPWFGLKICEGIIESIGGKIFSEVFGDAGLSKQDLTDALNEFIAAIAAVVHQQLELNDKRELDASAASLESLFELYLTNKDAHYLVPLVFKADELVHQALSLPLLMVPSFGIVGSLELVILQEVYLVSKRPQDKKAISVKAQALIGDSDAFKTALEAYNNGRFSPVGLTGRKMTTMPGHKGPLVPEYGYSLDQQWPPIGWNQWWSTEVAQARRQAHILQEFARLEKEILYPLYAVVDKWKQIAQ